MRFINVLLTYLLTYLKCKSKKWGNAAFRFWPPAFPYYNNLRLGNALSHKLEVGERRSLASRYTLTTGYLSRCAIIFNYKFCEVLTLT